MFVDIFNRRSGHMKRYHTPGPIPHHLPPSYSLFMVYSVGLANYTKWLELLAKPTPIKPFPRSCRILMGNSTPVPVEAEDVLHLAELTLDFWEASMTWWNMTDSERQPWIDMSRFKLQRWHNEGNVVPKEDVLFEQVFFQKHVLGSGMHYMNAIDVMKSCALHLESIPIASKLRKRRDEWLQRFQNTPWRAGPKEWINEPNKIMLLAWTFWNCFLGWNEGYDNIYTSPNHQLTIS